jgi:hypothetical protein
MFDEYMFIFPHSLFKIFLALMHFGNMCFFWLSESAERRHFISSGLLPPAFWQQTVRSAETVKVKQILSGHWRAGKCSNEKWNVLDKSILAPSDVK